MRVAWVGVLLVVVGGLCGCSSSEAYPRVTAAPAVGRAAQCDLCGKAIPATGEEHLFTFQGVRYTVCGEACEKQLEEAVVGGRFNEGGRRR